MVQVQDALPLEDGLAYVPDEDGPDNEEEHEEDPGEGDAPVFDVPFGEDPRDDQIWQLSSSDEEPVQPRLAFLLSPRLMVLFPLPSSPLVYPAVPSLVPSRAAPDGHSTFGVHLTEMVFLYPFDRNVRCARA